MTLSITVLATISFILLIIITRASYRIFRPDFTDNDSYAHLLFIQDIRNSGHRIPHTPSKIALPMSYGYPFLTHWVISFFPESLDLILDRWFSPIMDLLLSLIVLLLVPIGIITLSESLLGLGLILATGQLMRHDQPHARGLSARKPGLILVSLYGLFIVLFISTSNQIWILFAVLTTTAICLTSKFGLQSAFVISLSLLYFTPHSLTTLLAGGIIAVLSTKGKYWQVFRSQILHLHWYATEYQYEKFSHAWFSLKWTTDLQSSVSFLDILRWGKNNSLISTVFHNPILLILLMYMVGGSLGHFEVNVLNPYLGWAVGLLSAYVITSLPHMKFLGEPHRYIEYSIIPGTLLLIEFWVKTGLITHITLIGILTLGLLVVIGNIAIITRKSTKPYGSLDSIISWLKGKNPGVIMITPRSWDYKVAYDTSHSIVSYDLLEWSDELLKYQSQFTPIRSWYITNNTKWLSEEFDPGFVIFTDNRYMKGELSPPNMEPLYHAGTYQVYRWEDVQER